MSSFTRRMQRAAIRADKPLIYNETGLLHFGDKLGFTNPRPGHSKKQPKRVVTIDLRPTPRAIRGRNPRTGLKLGGAASGSSPAIRFGQSFRTLPASKNNDRAYRKQA